MHPGKRQNLLEKLVKKDSTAGIVLIVVSIAAIVLSNTPLQQGYHEFMNLKLRPLQKV